MDEWLAKNGWLGLFKHLLKNGVFQIDRPGGRAGGPCGPHGNPNHAAIAARIAETPWDKLARRMKLEPAPLFLDFDAAQLAAIDRESESLWARWFGAGWRASSSLAEVLKRKHHWGFRNDACLLLEEEQECQEATKHFESVLGTVDRAAAFEGPARRGAVGRRH